MGKEPKYKTMTNIEMQLRKLENQKIEETRKQERTAKNDAEQSAAFAAVFRAASQSSATQDEESQDAEGIVWPFDPRDILGSQDDKSIPPGPRSLQRLSIWTA